VLNVGCAPEDWQPALDSTEHEGVWAALALHPTELNGITDADYDRLETLLQHPRAVAVGETGLDYYWDRTTPELQAEHFRRHIDLAKRVGKPLMIHDREAHADVLRILREEGAPDVVVFHAFSGDADMARECVHSGYLLSFPGVLTFKNAPDLREACAVTPLEHILVETDAPFLTPHPYRGRPNSPYLIPHVLRLVADLHNTSERVACDTISATGARIYGL
jgi:TatD DNase family protein